MKNRLRELRKESNLPLLELSEITGLSFAVIQRLEKEERQFRQIHLDVLTNFFDVTSDYLLGKTDYGIGVFLSNGGKIYINEYEYNKYKPYMEISFANSEFDDDVILEQPNGKHLVLLKKTVIRVIDESRIKIENPKEILITKVNGMTEEQATDTLNFVNTYILRERK